MNLIKTPCPILYALVYCSSSNNASQIIIFDLKNDIAVMKLRIRLIGLATVYFFSSCSLFNKTTDKNAISVSKEIGSIKADTVKKTLKPYKEVITDKAITQKGLVTVHRVGERYFFEIANSFLNKDILIVSRISKGAAIFRSSYGDGYGGDYIGEDVIKFVKGPNNKLFIERSSFIDIANDSSENSLYRAVLNSTLPAIVASFDILAFSSDSANIVVDMTEYLNSDNDVFFFNARRNAYKLGSIQLDKSYVKSITSFPLNTEIRTIKTYTGEDRQVKTFEINSSIVLLPEQPMRPRYLDGRVGYFARGYRDFDARQGAETNFMINRWRLEPKDEDISKYKNGELVEPKKPIVFYIDPATPKKWVPFLIKGVNAWQKAFQKAGFKNAIYALEAPAEDSTWSLEDARHSAIVYKASSIQNASGPQISDPRTGEILESHINWYHNVQQLLHDWYMIQAGPNDPRARKMEFDDSLMGQLIQYVCTHEVGHTLGLVHNFAASSTIPVDSLRSKHYLSINGYTPSIMDYARFNYVAQPEDSIDVEDLIPRIGVYDEWAIQWGYKWLPDMKNKDEENLYLKEWIKQQQQIDKRLLFVNDMGDVRYQAEDLGDNPMKASYYGIKNLKIVMSHLVEWTKEPNKDYADLKRLSIAVFNQYNLYLNHVLAYVGGMYVNQKTSDQKGPVWTFVSKENQRAAIRFFQDQFFDTPEWLFNKEIFRLSGTEFVIRRQQILEPKLAWLLYPGRVFNFLFFNETNQSPNKSYKFDQLLTDLESGIWKELKSHQLIDLHRRYVQKTYAYVLVFNGVRLARALDFGVTDYCTIVNNHIKSICENIKAALPGYKDNSSKLHLSDVLNRLTQALNFQTKNFPENPHMVIGQGPLEMPQTSLLPFGARQPSAIDTITSKIHTNQLGCWQSIDDKY
jgi:hypothetical protein